MNNRCIGRAQVVKLDVETFRHTSLKAGVIIEYIAALYNYVFYCIVPIIPRQLNHHDEGLCFTSRIDPKTAESQQHFCMLPDRINTRS
jgi:hypothetical protein